jgi:hypothetical protein
LAIELAVEFDTLRFLFAAAVRVNERPHHSAVGVVIVEQSVLDQCPRDFVEFAPAEAVNEEFSVS